MGSLLSNLGTNGSTIGPGLGDIPECCVARVFLYLTPPEICNLARLNRAFRGAASADFVWETKLPHNYQDLLEFVATERHQNLCKKDIFALLSKTLSFDDGNKDVDVTISSLPSCVLEGKKREWKTSQFTVRLQCGWTGSLEEFAWLFRQERWQLLELMTGGFGIGFPLKNQGLYCSWKAKDGGEIKRKWKGKKCENIRDLVIDVLFFVWLVKSLKCRGRVELGSI
ncbi:unnamed protein product [Lupinus luteus]|uniref:F-box domain-containing protein n=1 Tax=Lupinus luteus TaxID=3873 RepID=A0AAV1X5N4_LUPLU